MSLLIDPPVDRYSSPEDLQDWLEELEALLEEYKGDPEAVGAVGQALTQARGWLEAAQAEELEGEGDT